MESDRQDIEDQAARFLQRRDAGHWAPADEAEFSAWMAASTAHRVAYLRTEAAWEAMGRLKALGAGLPHRQAPSPAVIDAVTSATTAERPGRQTNARELPHTRLPRGYKQISLAASLLAIAGLTVFVYQLWFRGQYYSTPVGGLTSIPLEDGSRIVLNTRSKVRVVLSRTERDVELIRGEAFFEVAKDPRRPFVVRAERARVVAVGTQFSVRRGANEALQVVVTEGKVRIEDSALAQPPLSPLAAGAPMNLVTAGEVARIGAGGLHIQEESQIAAEDSLAWRNGYLIFRNTSLAAAVAEFNRYSTRQIIVEDASLAAMPLTGKFRATNSEAFVNLLEQTFHVRVEETPTGIALTRLRTE